MEENCSMLTFNTRPPNVLQHLEALGYYGWISTITFGVTTLILVALFIANVAGFIRHSPPHRRLLLCWVTSFPMIISFLALMTLLIPRAGNLCDTVKQIFMPFTMMHFVDLTLNFKGGQSAALEDLLQSNTPMSLCLPPCCCVGLCVRQLDYTKKRLRVLKSLVYQMPLVQLAIIVLIVLLTEAEVIRRDKGPDGVFIFLNVLNIFCFCLAMWAFNIITRSFAPQLTAINFLYKAQLVGLGIMLMKLQNFVLVILSVSGVVPCIPPVTSRIVLQKTIDASLTLFEAFILGILTFIEYRKLDRQNEEMSPRRRQSQPK
ncbi:organic solute transporter subunit alpha-like [Daphnia pulicaria]|uniref:organic solute transporter subunit alpha-like n=1 Tax=Daphnia pulicaria TaxID=35523 RepID=UPI001EEA5874|nr:organic solute transporter subunit alpha-like [Daphnia pulicaria]